MPIRAFLLTAILLFGTAAGQGQQPHVTPENPADESACDPQSPTKRGSLGRIAGRDVSYRHCILGGADAFGAVQLDWADPKTGEKKSQTIYDGACAENPPVAEDGGGVALVVPDCTRYSEGDSTVLHFRFDAGKGLFVESGKTTRSPRGDALRHVEGMLAKGDLAGARGELALLGTDLSGGWLDHTAEWTGILLRGAHREASDRSRRGDKSGAAAVAAWFFDLPLTEGHTDCTSEGWWCVGRFDQGNLTVEKTAANIGMVNDLAFFLTEGVSQFAHPQMRQRALDLATGVLRDVTTAAPDRVVAWLNLGDAEWASNNRNGARVAYRQWWKLAQVRGQKMLSRVEERLKEAQKPGSP